MGASSRNDDRIGDRRTGARAYVVAVLALAGGLTTAIACGTEITTYTQCNAPSQMCECPDGTQGIQACTGDGHLQPCQCSGVVEHPGPLGFDAGSSSSSSSSGGNLTCGPDASVCDAACIDLAANADNCGACGKACTGGTICWNSQCVTDPATLVQYPIVDARYSTAIDSIVIASTSALHLLNPHTKADVSIALQATPTTLAVAPDGQHAAVGANGFLSYVDLVGRSVVATYPVSAPIGSVAFAGNGYAYAIPSSDQWVTWHIVSLPGGKDTTFGQVYAGSRAAVIGTTLFVADDLDPSTMDSYSLASATAPSKGSSSAFATYEVCDRAWPSKDGSLLYTGCGNVFHASDLSYAGSLGTAGQAAFSPTIAWVDDTSSDGTIAALASTTTTGTAVTAGSPINVLKTYAAMYFTPQTSAPLPPLVTPGGVAASNGLFVFHDAAGTGTYVLLHAKDPQTSADVYGITSF